MFHLTRKVWLTGMYNDGSPTIPLNPLQKRQVSAFLSHLANGSYTTLMRDKCPLCGSQHATLIAEKDRYGLPVKSAACASCGLIYLLDPLDQESALHFYSEQYRELYNGVNMTEAAWVEAVDKYYKRSETFAGGLEAFLWPARKTSLAGLKVLEVGCGGGWYLNSCRLRGAEVRGFDPDANCIKAGRERGIDISNGLSEDALAAGASADVVMLIHVLEHTLEPVEVLKTARQLLRNDGCLFVAVPGLKSVATGAWGGSLKLQIQGAHNYIWHRSPFERMAAAAGLSIVNWNDSIWCVMVPASSSSGCANIRQEPGTLQLLLTLRLAGLYWEFISRRFGPTSATYSVSQRLASLVARRTGLCKS